MSEFNYTAQMICACLTGERDALVKLKTTEMDKDGDAAAGSGLQRGLGGSYRS